MLIVKHLNFQRRGRKMDCNCCSYSAALLPTPLPRYHCSFFSLWCPYQNSWIVVTSPLLFFVILFVKVTKFLHGCHNNVSSCAPDWLELPGAIILLTVVAPSLFADTFRGDLVGIFICLAIGCYLLSEHIKASGGFRNAFRKGNGVSNSIGILLLFIYPVWALVLNFL